MESTLAEPPASPAMATKAEWKQAIEGYQEASTAKACWQLFSTLGALAATWFAMSLLLERSLWHALPLAFLAGGLLVRLFIFFHDCGHGSFFRSRWANDLTGFVTGLVTFTPYSYWRWQHAQHHATSGNLEGRGLGDVWTLTVKEYLQGSRGRRIGYRIARHPLALFVVGPVYLFLVNLRIPTSRASGRDRRSVWVMNLSVLAMMTAMSAWLGVWNYLVLQFVAIVFAGGAGIWLFYVQHQFEGTYWAHEKDWDYTAAALRGSSFYDLPAVLRWFSGNIGYHHIHHLSPRIANYNLPRCHRASPVFNRVKRMGLRDSLKSTRLHLWDEETGKLIGFGDLRRRLAKRA